MQFIFSVENYLQNYPKQITFLPLHWEQFDMDRRSFTCLFRVEMWPLE